MRSISGIMAAVMAMCGAGAFAVTVVCPGVRKGRNRIRVTAVDAGVTLDRIGIVKTR